ncbi:hypothetical protein NRK67_02495 [Fusobacteria bacterium ZRK30]|nr:hypothetical protein NRK67_02495 [Fusobacteria bacterium ZRK30]
MGYQYTFNATSSEMSAWSSSHYVTALNEAFEALHVALRKKYADRTGIYTDGNKKFYRNYNYNSITSYDRWIVMDQNNSYLEDISLIFKTSDGATQWYCPNSFGNVYPPKINETFEFTPDTGGGLPGEPFTPPIPSNSEKIEDIPFYENLLKNGEIGSFDDLTQAEFDYLQDEVQKGEVGLFDTLVNVAKDFFMGNSDSDAFRDVNISYDGDNPDIVAYYADNGLDTSKSYNINMDGIRVGYDTGDGFVPILENSGISKNGSYSVSKESKNNFLSNGDIFALHTVNGTLGNLGNPVPGAIAVSAAVVANDYLNKILDPVQQNQLDLLKSGYSYVVNKAQNLFNGFTSTGDRSKDLFNHAVQSEAYTKGITNVVQGGASMSSIGVDLKGQSIPIELPTSGIALTIPTTGVALNVPTTGVNLNIPTATNIPLGIPTTGVDLKVPTTGVSLDMDGKSIPISTGGEVALKVADTTKIKLDTTESTLKLEGLNNDWLALLKLLVTRFTHINTLNPDEALDLKNKLEIYQKEYAYESSARVLEGNVARWRQKEYETTITDNNIPLDKINRDVKAWQGMHSLNPAGTITDTIGNDIPIFKGIIPAIQGVGMLDAIRETLIDRGNENVLARAKAKSKTKDDEDEKKLVDNLFSILGVKLNAPIPTAEDLRKSPGLAAIYNAISNLSISNTDN